MFRRNEHEQLKIQYNISTTATTTEMMIIKSLCRQAIDSMYAFRKKNKRNEI